MYKFCKKCDSIRSIDDFNKDKSKIDGLRDICKECRNSLRRANRKNNIHKFIEYENRPENRAKQRADRLKREYDISVEEYDKLFEKQKGVCKVERPRSVKTGRDGRRVPK